MSKAFLLMTGPPRSFCELPGSFVSKVIVDQDRGCWLWQGGLGDGGYAHFKIKGRQWNGHKFSFVALGGVVLDGEQLDHLCSIKHCVNPFHLEPVTPQVNTLRGSGPSAVNARKAHCDHGHEFTPENTRITNKRRHCRECSRIRSRRHYYKSRGREVPNE